MPATVRGVNVFCLSQGLTGLNQGYNQEDTPETSQEAAVTQDAATEEPDNVTSQVSASGAVLSQSNVLIFCSAHPCSRPCYICPIPLGHDLCFPQA
jgi:hypothetical protein